MWPSLRLIAAWLPVGIYAGGILILSSAPKLPDIPGWDLPHIDKVLHALAYAGLTLLLIRALCLTFVTRPTSTLVLWGVILAISYGMCNEVIQAFTPTRTMSMFDGVANAIGASLAAWIWLWLERRWPAIAK